MNPLDPSSFHHRTERLSTGNTYHFIDQRPQSVANPTTLVLVHGFPDNWFGWRYQIGPLVRKNYRVIVPDMLGYGQTDKPTSAAYYSTKRLSLDLAALLDCLNISSAVFIGHDWGSFTVGRFALWHPGRLLGLVMISVPFVPPTQDYIPLDLVAQKYPNFGYQLYFEGLKSIKDVEKNLDLFLRLLYQPPNDQLVQFTKTGVLEKLLNEKDFKLSSPTTLNDQEFEFYKKSFSESGMNGPLNYYRTTWHRFNEEKDLPSKLRDDLPVLQCRGTKDASSPEVAFNNAQKFIPRLENFTVDKKGHWLMIETPKLITQKLLQWLEQNIPVTPVSSKL